MIILVKRLVVFKTYTNHLWGQQLGAIPMLYHHSRCAGILHRICAKLPNSFDPETAAPIVRVKENNATPGWGIDL